MAKYSGEITLAKVQDGSSGVSCTGSTTTYQVGTSGTVKPTGTWSLNIPAVSAGEYLWIKTTLSYSDASSSDIYSVSYMGTNGSQGVAGIDGKTAFVHIRFSAVANPTTASQISITPDKYIGLCTNNSSTAPTSPSDYTWSKFQGDDGQDGAQGIPGANGADGTTYYVHFAYADSSDGQTGFSTTVSANKSYIGQCVNTSQADPTDYSKYKWSLIKGADGVGISSITEHYAVSSSSTTAPTSWSLTPPVMSTTNKYLWNYETITYSDSTSMDTQKRVIGIYGDKGQDGSSGKGISSVVNYYLATSSSTGVTTSTSGWTTTVQNVTATNKNLWNYEVITYTDNSTTTTVPCIIGVYGDKGDKGDTGQGIDSITPEYYVSTSNSTQTGGSWSTTMPAWEANKYCWMRQKIVYKNPASTVYTTPQLDTNWNKMNDLDTKTTVLQTTVTQEQGKLAALIKQTDTDRKNTSDKFTDITADINGINTTIGNIQTAVGDNSDDIASINSQITTINVSAAGLETKVTKAQNDATAAQTTATQNADKIGLLVKSGTDESNLVLTPGALDAIANNINLTGKVTFSSLDTSTQNKINKTVASTSTEYANSTSQTVQPTTGWSSTMPNKETGKVIWSRKKVVYVDGTSAYQDYAPISGLNGKDGKDGTNGTNGKDGANGADAITLSITSSAGISFKGTQTATTLTCHVFRGGKELAATEISSLGTIRWYKDTGTTSVGTGATYTVAAGTVTSATSYTAKLEG